MHLVTREPSKPSLTPRPSRRLKAPQTPVQPSPRRSARLTPEQIHQRSAKLRGNRLLQA